MNDRVAYRIVVHGFASRELARSLADQLVPGAEPAGLSITIEADNFYTAEHEPQGSVIEPVSLRKDSAEVTS